MIRRPPRSTQSRSSAASDVYKRQGDHILDRAVPGKQRGIRPGDQFPVSILCNPIVLILVREHTGGKIVENVLDSFDLFRGNEKVPNIFSQDLLTGVSAHLLAGAVKTHDPAG